MKVLIVHNSYQKRGGEDAVVEGESRQLECHGHKVIQFRRHNDAFKHIAPWAVFSSGLAAVWSREAHSQISNLLQAETPDIVHCHNTFPLISPSIYYACADAHIPVVQTLHNYRLLCPKATLFRDGGVCESCLRTPVALPGILHACYRNSILQTSVAATMLAVHSSLRTWQQKIAVFIAVSQFVRAKFIQGGLPAERIVVKPNFSPLPPAGKAINEPYALFVGRLCVEKGPSLLVEAWKRLAQPVRLYIAGDGPLKAEIECEVRRSGLANVTFLGQLPTAEIMAWIRGSSFIVLPSLWFEGCPMTVIEAYACGVPVIASRLGTLEEIVLQDETGLLFPANDAARLAELVDWAWSHPAALKEMGRRAHVEYQRNYTVEKNYSRLMAIYEDAIAAA